VQDARQTALKVALLPKKIFKAGKDTTAGIAKQMI
jgi:hypothetical protein